MGDLGTGVSHDYSPSLASANSFKFSDYGGLDFAGPNVNGDVLQDFDFDSFLHQDGDDANGGFDFNSFGPLDGNELSAE